MEDVYDLHRHSRCALFYIRRTELIINVASTSTKSLQESEHALTKETCITYDKQKMNIKSWGNKYFESDNKDDIRIDNFMEQLTRLFKKDKNNQSQDDLFLLKAISDFIRLSMEKVIEESDAVLIKHVDTLHYVLVISSEWEEEMKELFLRPMFIQAGLLSKNDHKDRLLFCTDIESICYLIQNPVANKFYLERGKNTISCKLSPISKSKILIKLDLVSTVNPIFNFTGALIYPKIVRSNSLTLTIDDITDSIRAFIELEIPFAIQEEIIQIIMDISDVECLSDTDDEDETILLTTPLITDTSKWGLDKHQEAFTRSICLFDICAKISEMTFNNVKDLLLNNLVKEYNIFIFDDRYSSEIYPEDSLSYWSRYLLEYNRISFNAKNVSLKSLSLTGKKFEYEGMTAGVYLYVFNVIRNSDISSKPRILPLQKRTPLSFIFLMSKAEAIMNIDISLKSTLLSFSLLDEKGYVKKIWNHDYFVTDTSLWSLGSFFSSPELKMLTVRYSFAEDYLMGDISSFSDFIHAVFNTDIAMKIESIMRKSSHIKDFLVSTRQHIYQGI